MSIDKVYYLDIWKISRNGLSKNNLGYYLSCKEKDYKENLLINCKKSLLYFWTLFKNKIFELCQIINQNVSNND